LITARHELLSELGSQFGFRLLERTTRNVTLSDFAPLICLRPGDSQGNSKLLRCNDFNCSSVSKIYR